MKCENKRAQIYTLEAVIAALIIITVAIFVAPSMATPSYEDQTAKIAKEDRMEDHLSNALDTTRENGALKSTILNFSEKENQFIGPSLPGKKHLYKTPKGEFGKTFREFENEHNVVINVLLIPESNATNGKRHPNSTYYIKRQNANNPILVDSTTIILYNSDKLRSPRTAHSHLASATSRTAGGGIPLKETNQYPVPQSIDNAGNQNSIYNVVTVRVIIHKPASTN